MIADRFKLIEGAIIFLVALFVISILLGYTLVSSITKAFIFPVFLHLYFTKSDIESKSFIGFLLMLSFLAVYCLLVMKKPIMPPYLIGMLYICLLICVIKGFNFKQQLNYLDCPTQDGVFVFD